MQTPLEFCKCFEKLKKIENMFSLCWQAQQSLPGRQQALTALVW
jgi:hypothetical protein